MLFPIVEYPDPRLNQPSLAVSASRMEFIRQIIPTMFATMDAHGAIGLAGIQIGLGLRIFVMDTSSTGYIKSVGRRVFINPEILSVAWKRTQYEEGCLSFPGVILPVTRPSNLQIQACDENFEEFTLDLDGIDAICFQHELDHLNGITFNQHQEPLRSAS